MQKYAPRMPAWRNMVASEDNFEAAKDLSKLAEHAVFNRKKVESGSFDVNLRSLYRKTGGFKPNDKITFGKYKGEVISDILFEDPRYFLWACSTIEWFKLNREAFKILLKALRNKSNEEASHNRFDSCDKEVHIVHG